MNSLAEPNGVRPLDKVHLVPLDFDLVHELPESHVWTPLGDYSANTADVDSVPVIDLNDPNAMEHVYHACEEWGMFQILNHGIPMQLLDEVHSEVLRLFTLPTQEKLKTLRAPESVTGYCMARISSFHSKLMWSEGFTIMGSPVEHAKKLWPEDYNKFCDIMEKYSEKMEDLSGRMMWVMLNSLGLTGEDVKWVGPTGKFEGVKAPLQLNSYPPCPDPDRAMGLAPHTDTSLFTLLYQNSIRGLKTFRNGVGWVTVPPIPGALIVNVGDLFQIISNGRFKSPLHHAFVNPTHHRVTFAYFYGPPPEVELAPLAKLIDDNHPLHYRPVTWNEYRAVKAKHYKGALEAIRV